MLMSFRNESAFNTQTVAHGVDSLVVRRPPATKTSYLATQKMPDNGVPLPLVVYRGVRVQVDRPAAESSRQIHTATRTAAPTHPEATRQLQITVREYLVDDPDHYIPSHKGLRDQKVNLMRQTISVVKNLLD